MDRLRLSTVFLFSFLLVTACAGGGDTVEDAPTVPVPPSEKDVHDPCGRPVAMVGDLELDVRVRQGYARGFETTWKIPAWVGYRLDYRWFKPGAPSFDRLNRYLVDPDLTGEQRITHNHYTGTKFERGQMAPQPAMQGRTEDIVRESYYMSNVAPQYASLELRLWMNLEGQVRKWVRKYGRIYVVTGPVFAKSAGGRKLERAGVQGWMKPAKPGIEGRVAIPTHFYKIVYRKDDDELRTLAFVVPNQSARFADDWDFGRWQVTVDEVEKLTGFDFLSRLPNELEDELESTVQPVWE
ncbi:MAG: DNA/RNA non-specific endonuclease [Planctomycetota bacterium]